MTNRLEYIYSLIEPDSRGVADIGTDHGYIPIALASRKYRGSIYASDINSAPLKLAIDNASTLGLSEHISFSLCSGLSMIPLTELDTIIIAGMGGDTICSILDEAEAEINESHTLILQPMSKQEILRYWLINNNYSILLDDYVEDNGRIFSIIKARLIGNGNCYSDYELYAGKISLSKDSKLFIKNLIHQKSIFSDIVNNCSTTTTKTNFIRNFTSKMIIEIESALERINGK